MYSKWLDRHFNRHLKIFYYYPRAMDHSLPLLPPTLLLKFSPLLLNQQENDLVSSHLGRGWLWEDNTWLENIVPWDLQPHVKRWTCSSVFLCCECGTGKLERLSHVTPGAAVERTCGGLLWYSLDRCLKLGEVRKPSRRLGGHRCFLIFIDETVAQRALVKLTKHEELIQVHCTHSFLILHPSHRS